MAKKGSRLNDTAAVAAMPMADTKSSSVNVRKIDNGFIKCTSSHGQHGYNYTEEFSASKPSMDGSVAPDASGNSMSRAIGYMRRTDAI